VVTAWIGIDQSLGDAHAPLIFGTAALMDPVQGRVWQSRQYYAATEDAALANHRMLERRLRDIVGE
jgi:hypothetical protein